MTESMLSNRMRRNFQVFCDGTSLIGFTELYHSKNKFWTTFWAILLAASISLTIYQVHKAISQYVNPNTSTYNQPLKGADLLLYPPLKICYQHWLYWIDFEKAFVFNFTKAGLLYSLSFMTKVYSSELFNIEEAKLEFETAYIANNFPTIIDFYKAVARPLPFIDKDTRQVANDSKFFAQTEFASKNFFDKLFCYVSDMDKQKSEWFRFYVSLFEAQFDIKSNVMFALQDPSYNNIKKFVTEFEHAAYMLDYILAEETRADNHLENSRLISELTNYAMPYLIYPDGFSNEQFTVSREFQYVKIFNDIDAHRWKPYSFPCNVGERMLMTNFTCTDNCIVNVTANQCSCFDIRTATILNEMDLNKLCAHTITFLGINETRNISLSTGECSANITGTINAQCEDSCVIATGECVVNTTDKMKAKCQENCMTACEIWEYSFRAATINVDALALKLYTKNVTYFHLQYPKAVTIQIETDNLTWEDFVGNVGGLLGVWTGASIISIIQIFYLCCFSDIEPALPSLRTNKGRKTEIKPVDQMQ